jgi:hypothetical protein
MYDHWVQCLTEIVPGIFPGTISGVVSELQAKALACSPDTTAA